jgi:hypothetical protein
VVTLDRLVALAAILYYVSVTIFSILAWWASRKAKIAAEHATLVAGATHAEIQSVKNLINGHDRDG